MYAYYLLIFLFFFLPSATSLVIIPRYLSCYDKESNLWFSFLMALLVGVLGYCFKDPMTHPDIEQYIGYLHSYSGKRLFECFNNNGYENLYIFHTWLWIIEKIGDEQLLPASAVFFYYFNLFYVLGDYRVRKKLDMLAFGELIFAIFCMSQFAFILNSFRSYVAFSCVFLALYRECIQGKKGWVTIALYICPVFIHVSAFVLIIIRVIANLKNRSWAFTGFIILSAREIISILAEKLSSVSSSAFILGTVKTIIMKADMYFRWTEGGWATRVKNSGYYRLVKIFCFVIIISAFWVIIKDYCSKNEYNQKKVKTKGQKSLKIYYTFGVLYLLVTLETFLITAPECFRFVFPIIPYIYMYIHERSIESENMIVDVRFLKLFLIGMTCIGIFLNVYNLNTMINFFDFFQDVIVFHPGHF